MSNGKNKNSIDNIETIQEAKEFLAANFAEGASCPCCGRLVKKYKRKIHKSMAIALINLYKLNKKKPDYYHLEDFVKGVARTGSNDFSKLKLFGLVEDKELEPDSKKRKSGYWGITRAGILFVEKKLRVPEYLYIFNGLIVEVAKESISIDEAFKNVFDYKELMEGV